METAVLAKPPSKTVQVWDPLLRISHWTLAAGFAVAFIAEEGDLVHQVAGYIVAGAVAIRLAWGFVGPRHARFGDFVTGPRVLFAHLADMLRFRERRYLGHNPAAGAMAITLLGLMLWLAVTGWMLTTNALYGLKWLETLHEGAANLALGLVFLHIAAAVYESLRQRESLPWAMVTGRKRV
ncbi:MAG TPA: cytochrome b/b6 domain-containing protein [Acetobacteraceae bacterium]|nr:cytochrome b/b6 domain-containing protein [Acetobacteraceae bacterium]